MLPLDGYGNVLKSVAGCRYSRLHNSDGTRRMSTPIVLSRQRAHDIESVAMSWKETIMRGRRLTVTKTKQAVYIPQGNMKQEKATHPTGHR